MSFQAVVNAVRIFEKFCHERWDELKAAASSEGMVLNSFLELVTDSRGEPGLIFFLVANANIFSLHRAYQQRVAQNAAQENIVESRTVSFSSACESHFQVRKIIILK